MTTLELFNIVLLSILAFATLAYATLTFFVLREQRRGKKKPVIEEMLRIVIHPLLNDVERERQFLSQSKFEWQHSSKRMVCNSLVPTKSGGEKMVLANFFIEYPEIFKLLFKHLKNWFDFVFFENYFFVFFIYIKFKFLSEEKIL